MPSMSLCLQTRLLQCFPYKDGTLNPLLHTHHRFSFVTSTSGQRVVRGPLLLGGCLFILTLPVCVCMWVYLGVCMCVYVVV